MDQFAQIAANGIGGNAALLEPVTPIPHETVICRLEQADAQPIAVKPHLSTTEELKTKLAAMREAYRPFLENHAPAFESLRRRMDLTLFLRDGQPVTIPEYGGPIGVCKKTYETTFELPALLAGQSVYIHFDGADYRAVVTVNDTFGGARCPSTPSLTPCPPPPPGNPSDPSRQNRLYLTKAGFEPRFRGFDPALSCVQFSKTNCHDPADCNGTLLLRRCRMPAFRPDHSSGWSFL